MLKNSCILFLCFLLLSLLTACSDSNKATARSDSGVIIEQPTVKVYITPSTLPIIMTNIVPSSADLRPPTTYNTVTPQIINGGRRFFFQRQKDISTISLSVKDTLVGFNGLYNLKQGKSLLASYYVPENMQIIFTAQTSGTVTLELTQTCPPVKPGYAHCDYFGQWTDIITVN